MDWNTFLCFTLSGREYFFAWYTTCTVYSNIFVFIILNNILGFSENLSQALEGIFNIGFRPIWVKTIESINVLAANAQIRRLFGHKP